MDAFIIVLLIGLAFAGYGIHILNRGWARRWELFPFLGILGSSIFGTDKVYGGSAKFAGFIHIVIGIGVIVLFLSQ